MGVLTTASTTQPNSQTYLLGHLAQHLENLANEFLGHDLEDLVLLQSLTGDVQRKIVTINDTANEVQVAGHHVLELFRDEHLAHVQPMAQNKTENTPIQLHQVAEAKNSTCEQALQGVHLTSPSKAYLRAAFLL